MNSFGGCTNITFMAVSRYPGFLGASTPAAHGRTWDATLDKSTLESTMSPSGSCRDNACVESFSGTPTNGYTSDRTHEMWRKAEWEVFS